jgi:serine/threonine protein kinase
MSEGESLFKSGDVAFGKYRIQKLLGSGSFGEVYEAVETGGPARCLALKVLLPKHNSTPTIPQRFQDEARYLREIRTRRRTNAFPDVYDFGYAAEYDMHFIALEKIKGTQILHEMQRYPTGMPAQDAVRYTVKILVALAEAHHAGIVHRDLKPENVMLTDQGEIRILDFGIAKSLDEELVKDRRMTKTGAYLGTPNYMSPEQCTGGKKLDGRSDLFAVATMLYEMLAGKDPFGGDSNPMTTMYKINHGDPPALPPSVPTYIQEAVMIGLQKDPDKRWQNTEEFINALENDGSEAAPDARRSLTRFEVNPDAITADPGMAVSRPPPPATNLPPVPVHTSSPAPPSSPSRNEWLKIVLAGLGALMAVSAVLIAVLRRPHPPTRQPPRARTARLVQQDTPPVTAVIPRDAGAILSQDVEPVIAPPPHSSPDAAVAPADRNTRRSRRDAGRSADRPHRPRAPRCRSGYTLTDGQCCRRLGAGGMDCDGNE